MKIRRELHRIRPGTTSSLGVEVTLHGGGNGVSVLIPRNSALPASMTKRYGVVRDGQRSVAIRMLEGEGEDPEDCLVIGTCRIEPLPPDLKRGSPIDVTFTYDNSGRLHIKAVEGRSQSWASLTVERRFGIGNKVGTPI